MKKLLALLLLVACSATPTLQDRKSFKVDTPFGSGSGFPLTLDTYLTAAHVVGTYPPNFVTVDGLTAIEIIRIPGMDAAIIVMEHPHGHQPWPIDIRPLVPGERVTLSGYGAGIHWWTDGIVADETHISLSICPGDSGGPILDSNLDVIAIILTQGAFAQHHAGVLPIADLYAGL